MIFSIKCKYNITPGQFEDHGRPPSSQPNTRGGLEGGFSASGSAGGSANSRDRDRERDRGGDSRDAGGDRRRSRSKGIYFITQSNTSTPLLRIFISYKYVSLCASCFTLHQDRDRRGGGRSRSRDRPRGAGAGERHTSAFINLKDSLIPYIIDTQFYLLVQIVTVMQEEIGTEVNRDTHRYA